MLYVIIGVTLWVSFVVFGAIAAVGLVIAIGHLASTRTGVAHSGSRSLIGAH